MTYVSSRMTGKMIEEMLNSCVSAVPTSASGVTITNNPSISARQIRTRRRSCTSVMLGCGVVRLSHTPRHVLVVSVIGSPQKTPLLDRCSILLICPLLGNRRLSRQFVDAFKCLWRQAQRNLIILQDRL